MSNIKSYSGEIAAPLADYRTRAQDEAKNCRPPQDAVTLDRHESELKSLAEQWINNEQHLYLTEVTDASRAVSEASQKLAQHEIQIDQLLRDDSVFSAVDTELANDRGRITKVIETRLRAELELRHFRVRNNITSQAVYPESKLWHIGVLAILGLIEVVVNAFFYENSQGLLGGLTVALGIAFVNMGSALGLGFGFRYKNLASPDKRVVGWSCLIVFVLVAILCNSLFASFRSEYQLVVDPSEFDQVSHAFKKAWPEALLIFKLKPKFQDHWSFILFGVGLILSFWAFQKGYTFDDKYPDHGRLDRAHREAADREQQEQQLAQMKIRELLHHRKAAVQDAIQQSSTQISMLARRAADLNHARQQLERQAQQIESHFKMVLDAYRQANLAVRVVPAPQYFSEPCQLGAKIDVTPGDVPLQHLADMQQRVKDTSDRFRDSLNAKLRELQENSAHVLTKTIKEYWSDVQQEAGRAMADSVHYLKPAQA
ncbi:MAG: hypothetical protein RJA34_1868 [Pseudomonadota bacterium]